MPLLSKRLPDQRIRTCSEVEGTTETSIANPNPGTSTSDHRYATGKRVKRIVPHLDALKIAR